MAATAILKNRTILISSQPIDQFRRNLAHWCVSTLWTPITNKISRFQKCTMTAAAILKIRKIAISLQRKDRFGRNFVKWCVCALKIPSANKNSRFLKSNMAAAAILKNREILISSQPIDQFWRNLANWCVSTLWTLITNKIRDLKNLRWRRQPSWKFEKSQYLCNGTTDCDEIWHSYVSWPSRHRQSITFHKFGRHLEKSKNLNIFATDWQILTKIWHADASRPSGS